MRTLGAFTPGSVITWRFNTADDARAPITLAGSPVVSIYKDADTTETTTGVTLTVGFDARTGMHDLTVDTSTDTSFYAAGSTFFAVITTGTVDSISVIGRLVGLFRLGSVSAASGLLQRSFQFAGNFTPR